MDSRSSIDLLRQLDINYIIYVALSHDDKCKDPVSAEWLQGYHQAVNDASEFLRNGKP
jgi:hypothetical protein